MYVVIRMSTSGPAVLVHACTSTSFLKLSPVVDTTVILFAECLSVGHLIASVGSNVSYVCMYVCVYICMSVTV